MCHVSWDFFNLIISYIPSQFHMSSLNIAATQTNKYLLVFTLPNKDPM